MALDESADHALLVLILMVLCVSEPPQDEVQRSRVGGQGLYNS